MPPMRDVALVCRPGMPPMRDAALGCRDRCSVVRKNAGTRRMRSRSKKAKRAKFDAEKYVEEQRSENSSNGQGMMKRTRATVGLIRRRLGCSMAMLNYFFKLLDSWRLLISVRCTVPKLADLTNL
ncbi:hypothetical protein OROGR_029322 [Orobanche gracilis]